MNAKSVTIIGLSLSLCACFVGTGEKDKLRNPIANTGISMGLQVNLPLDSTQATNAATIYKNGVRQPLVGGDFFSASSVNYGDSAVLKSLQNLAGDYQGYVEILDSNDQVIIETVFDPERAREDRWYPVDELLINPGPNEDLVGYAETFSFPSPLENLSIGQTAYTSRLEDIDLMWTPADGDQMTVNAIVTCYNGQEGSISYPIFFVLGDDDGASSALKVGEIIPNTNIIDAVVNIQQEVAAIIAASIISTATYGLIDVTDIPLQTFQTTSCNVNLTVFREIGFDLPTGVAGGFAISSSSDTVSFDYYPGGI